MTDSKLSELITTLEASKILGLTQRRILQAINEGLLEAVKVGGRWLVKRESVYRYQEVVKR